MELQHFSHQQHPLAFNEEPDCESEEVYCSGCGELVSGPSFGCVQCEFYLDKQCAEAPSEMNHPFHRNHSLDLLTMHPYEDTCNFCGDTCENFVYHCSCNLDLHIKCALFSRNVAEKRNAEFQDIPRIDPSIATGNCIEGLEEAECFACWKPLLDAVYLSPDCGFYLHAKCADLPAEINHPCHQEHPLLLQFNSQSLHCSICQITQDFGFVYSCSPCKFVLDIQCATVTNTIQAKINQPSHRKHPLLLRSVEEGLPCQICQQTTYLNDVVYVCSICNFVLHIRCASSPPVIKDKLHNEFILVQRSVSLICDACGTSGNYVPYYCSTSNLLVHKKCISLPRNIKFFRHQHCLSHTYFLEQHEQEMWECGVCYEEVNTEHGSYFCSKCNYMFHVNCATEDPCSFHEVESIESEEETDSDECLDLREIVTDTWIKHSWHQHNLTLSTDIRDFKQCDGCLLPIGTSFYHCSQCDFSLHKACAELPLKKHIWFHRDQKPLRLTFEGIFRCVYCFYETSGFGYRDEFEDSYCLRCSLVPDITRCEGHEHKLGWYDKFKSKWLCNACGDSTWFGYKCKSCDFALHWKCLILPLTARHRFDEHPFKLTYDDDDYSESNCCDICEKERNPKHWFYHCSACNTSAHTECVLGKYTFIKPGTVYTERDHPHPLTFVRKVELYPKCLLCREYCIDLSLEYKTNGCGYIVHWECMKPHCKIAVDCSRLQASPFFQINRMTKIVRKAPKGFQFVCKMSLNHIFRLPYSKYYELCPNC